MPSSGSKSGANARVSTRDNRVSGRYAGKAAACRRQERYGKVLEAGIRIIGTQGHEAATLRAVSREAGLTERYFYEAFENREALLIAAYQKIADEVLLCVRRAVMAQAADPVAMVQAGLQANFDYIAAAPDRARLLYIECLGIGPGMDRSLGLNLNRFADLILGLAQPLLPRDIRPPAELRVMARGVLGAVVYLSQQWIRSGMRQPRDELVNGSMEICLGLAQRLGVDLAETGPV